MPSVSLMLKPSSSLCNMACKYCFYHDEAAMRRQYSLGMMTEDTAHAVIDKALDFASGAAVSFVFQGGEPTLAGLDFYRDFVRYLQNNNAKNSTINLAMQTNGLLIDEEWAKFFRDNKFLLGLSLDGNKSCNRLRVDGAGQATFDRVIAATEVLKRCGVDFNILIVATKFTVNRVEEIYNFFNKYGYKYLQFIPCLAPPRGSKNSDNFAMNCEEYGQFLTRLFDLYIASLRRGEYTSIRYFDNLVRLHHEGVCEQCGTAGQCGLQFVVEGNGNVYPCDFYCTDQWMLGNINQTSLRELTGQGESFVASSPRAEAKCRECRHYNLCRGGGCRRMREDSDYCNAYRKFLEYATPIIAAIRY